MTDEATLAVTRLRCAGPGCAEFYELWAGAPDSWLFLCPAWVGGEVRRFCGVACLRRWADRQRDVETRAQLDSIIAGG